MANYFRSGFTALAFLALAGSALAHTAIKTSNIEAGGTYSESPKTFEFSFGKPVGLAGLELETRSGEVVVINFQPEKSQMTDYSIELPAIGIGEYVLKWRAIAKDGHVMKGQVDFSVVE